jgi:hypothetical protein
LQIDASRLVVESYGFGLAVPISLPVDIGLGAGEIISLDVKVTQDGSAGPVSVVLAGKLALKGLPELRDGMSTTISSGVHEYSQIDVQTQTITPADRNGPILLRSTSSVKIAKDISVEAGPMPTNAQNLCPGGPGGGTGGKGGSGLGAGGAGSAGTGPYAGLTSGNPGRFESSDQGLAQFLSSTQNRSSGGAGGNGAVVGGQGGRGGGGGGAIEIVAGGNLEVGAINARGIDGDNGALGGQKGGGGSGGIIILRAGGSLKAGNLDVTGRGAGQSGRARYDAGGTTMLPSGQFGDGHYHGPMFVDPPLITRSEAPEITVAGRPLAGFRYFVINEKGAASEPTDGTIGAAGTTKFKIGQDLALGASQLCLVVPGADAASDTRNCAYIGYLR